MGEAVQSRAVEVVREDTAVLYLENGLVVGPRLNRQLLSRHHRIILLWLALVVLDPHHKALRAEMGLPPRLPGFQRLAAVAEAAALPPHTMGGQEAAEAAMVTRVVQASTRRVLALRIRGILAGQIRQVGGRERVVAERADLVVMEVIRALIAAVMAAPG